MKAVLPEWLKKPLRGIRLAYYRTGHKYQCPVCMHTFGRLKPIGEVLSVNIELKVVSALAKERGECPYCTSRQRLRLLWLYLSQQGLVEAISEKEILHFAPEKPLFRKFQGVAKRYVCADMDTLRYAFCEDIEKQNLTELRYAEGSFDWLICNHVLEHIPDDSKAMAEIFRVLKPGGVAFLTVPISLVLAKTREDPTITTPEEREKLFGQYDHVRVYTRADFIARLEGVGFKVTPSRPTLTEAEEARYAIAEKEEEIFVCTKR